METERNGGREMGEEGRSRNKRVMETREEEREGRLSYKGINLISFWLVVTELMKLDERVDLRRH